MSQIVRVWFGSTVASRADEYLEYVRKTGVKNLTATPGNQGVLVLKRTDGEIAEIAVISFWESREAIKEFAGDDINKAVYYPEDKNFLLNMEPELTHYEIAIAEKIQIFQEPKS